MAAIAKDHLVELASLAENNKIKPLIGKVASFENSIQLITDLENGEKVTSKTVITMK